MQDKDDKTPKGKWREKKAADEDPETSLQLS
jgi:hypothetical protein